MNQFFTNIATGKPSCSACGLHKTAKTHKMPVIGKGLKGIFVLSGEPSATEDNKGIPMSGDSGIHFGKMLKGFGLSLEEDCWRTNAVRCHVPTDDALKYVPKCQASIHKIIKDCKPTKIFILGTVALASFYHNCPEVINSLPANRGLSFWDSRYNCWVFPLTHPSVYQETKDQAIIADAKRTLENAIEHYSGSPEIPLPAVKKLITLDAVTDYLNYLLTERPTFAFDYEATGLKPQLKGHKAISVGICTDKGAVSFPLEHPFWTKEQRTIIIDLWKQVLFDKKIKKVVQAYLMEYVWSVVRFGPTNGVIYDTQLASHVLDNREGGFFGLKFQSFLRWGVRNYSTLDQYIKAKNGEKFNNMLKAPIDALLQYNGLDALYTYHIWKEQKLEFEGNELEAYRFYHRGLTTLAEMHLNGVCIDVEYYKNQNKILTMESQEAIQKIEESPEATAFQKKYKRKLKATSNDDLVDLFYGILGFDSIKQTSKGKDSVDEEALRATGHPIALSILKARKIDKINGTYVLGFLREEAQGFMHPVFQLHKVATFRSSSAMPNFQNIAKRDKKAKKITRSGIIPRKKRVIVEADFSGAEVCVSAMYHKDRNFINYLLDKDNTDMHRDCYSFDTRILTENGFKYYDEISSTDRVAQYNENTNKIEYVFPTDRICYDYAGDMYRIHNRYIDVCVTPNHRMYLKRAHKEFEIIKAKDIKKSVYYSKTGANITEEKVPPKFYFAPVYGIGTNSAKKYHEECTIKPSDMFELLGYLVTDGHFKYHKQGAYRINLSQIKEPHRSKMKSCIDRIKSYTNFNFHEEISKWSMSNKTICTWLCDNFGVNKVNRKLPDFIKKAPIELLQIFFDACMLGDGRFNKSGESGTLFTVSTQFVDDFQFLCMRLGYSSKITKLPLKGNRTIQVYAIHILLRDVYRIKGISPTFTMEKYRGRVFCFTVPSGLLVTQRNNKISVQGNCAQDLWLLRDLWKSLDPGIAKGIRQNTKADWTFAEFYGSYWKKCAVAMWKKRSIIIDTSNNRTLEDHLFSKGMTTQDKFFKHVEAFEKKFWGKEMFGEYAEWKKRNVREYLKNGYIETYFGFRLKGLMNDREVNNYQTQGTSFHLLLHTAYELSKRLKAAGMKTLLVGQIHDSIVADVPTDELAEYCRMFKSLLAELPSQFDWMIVPIMAEMEASRPREEGGSFAYLEGIDLESIDDVTCYEDIIFLSTVDANGESIQNAKRIPLVAVRQ